jgi:16S rRNA (guanine966-N2)-methyltransferase
MELRPTGDRLKETLFNILGARVRDAVFVDAFAGTGSIGLEALSRGACEVIFIESSAAAVRLLRKNLDICRLEEGYLILHQEIYSALRSLQRRDFKCDLFFLDPPYKWQEYGVLLGKIFCSGLIQSNSLVIVEHHRKAPMPEDGLRYHRTRTVRQGDHCLSFYAWAP